METVHSLHDPMRSAYKRAHSPETAFVKILVIFYKPLIITSALFLRHWNSPLHLILLITVHLQIDVKIYTVLALSRYAGSYIISKIDHIESVSTIFL